MRSSFATADLIGEIRWSASDQTNFLRFAPETELPDLRTNSRRHLLANAAIAASRVAA
jgi:hypothetical protein